MLLQRCALVHPLGQGATQTTTCPELQIDFAFAGDEAIRTEPCNQVLITKHFNSWLKYPAVKLSLFCAFFLKANYFRLSSPAALRRLTVSAKSEKVFSSFRFGTLAASKKVSPAGSL